MGVTDSLTEFQSALVAHLASYTDGGAAPNTITAAVSGRVYSEVPPDPTPPNILTTPYVLVSFDRLPPLADMDWHRVGVFVEVVVVHRPRENIAAARRIADLAAKALINWDLASGADGSVRFRSPAIDVLPRGTGAADREIVQVRVFADGYSWWRGAA